MVNSGQSRIVLNPRKVDPWREMERYWIVPNHRSARLLVPAAHRTVAGRSLSNYRGLRRRRDAIRRAALGGWARAGLPLSLDVVSVQVPDVVSVQVPDDAAAPGLPVAHLSKTFGRQVHASIGVRTGANRKATLQLVDDRGAPTGYAKFAWNDVTIELVRNETRVLSDVGSASGPTRTPRLLASGELQGLPYLVTEPLPPTCRGARISVAAPNSVEFFALCPIRRHGPLTDAGQFRSLLDRIRHLRADTETADLLSGVHTLLDTLRRRDSLVPITARWHGDLTPWNCARDIDGQLWCWDWESSEDDAVAGLDSLHWGLSVTRERGLRTDASALSEALVWAEPHLRAAGVDRDAWPDVVGLYVAIVVERACALAIRAAGWQRSWVQPDQLVEMTGMASHLLATTRPPSRRP